MNAIYEASKYEPRKSVGHLINRIKGGMFAALDHEISLDPQLSALEVTASQYTILTNLAEGDSESTARFCKMMSYDPGAMTRMVDRLEAKGLIRRNRNSDDRRLVNLELTEAGHAAVPRLRECSVRVLNKFLTGFSKADAAMLEQLLERMAANM